MKYSRIAAVVMILLAACTVANAQINLKSLKNKAQNATKKVAGNNTATQNGANDNGTTDTNTPAAQGRTFYVSATTGSARADGLSATTAMKDLQKAIDAAQDNDVILVAEGNYLGNLDRGYIQNGSSRTPPTIWASSSPSTAAIRRTSPSGISSSTSPSFSPPTSSSPLR